MAVLAVGCPREKGVRSFTFACVFSEIRRLSKVHFCESRFVFIADYRVKIALGRGAVPFRRELRSTRGNEVGCGNSGFGGRCMQQLRLGGGDDGGAGFRCSCVKR